MYSHLCICEPINGSVLNKGIEKLKVKGYAYSGGGHSIVQVLFTIDNGKSWSIALLKSINQPLYRY